MFMFPAQRFRRSNLAVIQTVILRPFNLWLKPEFRLPVRAMNVNMHA
jgi:hypothetical protein